MQYNDDITTPFNGKELKKRLENIQGEIRYLSYTSEALCKELALISRKIEEIGEEMVQEDDFESPWKAAYAIAR